MSSDGEYDRFIDALCEAEWNHDTDYDGETKWEELSPAYRANRHVRMGQIMGDAATRLGVTLPPDTDSSAPS